MVKETHGMLALHTTKADLYSRLWCVYEVSSAEAWKVKVQASVSDSYKQETIRRMTQSVTLGFGEKDSLATSGLHLNTAAARCSKPEDEEYIMTQIKKAHGGFEKLDEQVLDFRMRSLPIEVQTMRKVARLRDGSYS
eukprot:216737-Amphidinium_carterae.1